MVLVAQVFLMFDLFEKFHLNFNRKKTRRMSIFFRISFPWITMLSLILHRVLGNESKCDQ